MIGIPSWGYGRCAVPHVKARQGGQGFFSPENAPLVDHDPVGHRAVSHGHRPSPADRITVCCELYGASSDVAAGTLRALTEASTSQSARTRKFMSPCTMASDQ